jgi:hypothetical protein
VAALAALASAAPAAAAYEGVQLGWRFCSKCRGLVYSPKNEALGVCPAGGKHKPSKAVNYVLYETQQGDNLHGPWNRCTKCAGLVTADQVGGLNVCPKGGQHARDTARSFKVYIGPGTPGVTDDFWDACRNCNGLFHCKDGVQGKCPAIEEGHRRLGFHVKLVMLY